MYRAILYDLGDVFFEAHYWRRWMFERLRATKHFLGSFVEFYNAYEHILIPVYEGREEYEVAYDRFLKRLNMPEPEAFKRQSLTVKKYFERNRTLLPEVRTTLKELHRRGIVQVVVTDNESTGEELRDFILRRFAIHEYITEVVTSREVGARKPAREIFKYALMKAGVPVEHALFVGHDQDEIDGAALLGFKTVQFNNYMGIQTQADFKVDCFSELLHFAGVPTAAAVDDHFPETW